MNKKRDGGITKIAVKGFKSIKEKREIEIRPLTIIAGANSSGKSSIMQPLLMLKQTLDASYDPGPLLINGPNVQFTEAAQFLSKISGKEGTNSFQILVYNDLYNVFDSMSTSFSKGSDLIEIVEMTVERKVKEMSSSSKEMSRHSHITLKPNMSQEELNLVAEQPLIRSFSNNEMPEELKWLHDIDSQIYENLMNIISKEKKNVRRSRCFFGVNTENGIMVSEITRQLADGIQDIIHLPGLRGNPERTYKMTGTGPQYPGTFENYVASLIHKWQAKKNRRLKAVSAALRLLKLAGQVGTDRISDAHIELQVGRLPQEGFDETDMVNIADVGFGVSQVLPVLVALSVARPSQLVYLEQPELHLHPNAQVVLARILANAAKRGVHVVAETHSSLLLLGIQTLVAEGKLSPELVKLHWFSRNKDGITEIDSVDLDEAGTYGEWSVDFDDVAMRIQSQYLDAIDNIRFGQKEDE